MVLLEFVTAAGITLGMDELYKASAAAAEFKREEQARKAKVNNEKKTEIVKPESCSNEGDVKDLKRKDSEDGNEGEEEEASSKPKKPKVALSHLQDIDDTEADQEEE